MATIVGGFDTGLADGSLFLLNRNDRTRIGTEGHEEEMYVNVSNGNLILRHVDAFLPSQGEDTTILRTYNSRGTWNGNVGQGWAINTFILELSQITNNIITLVNPDSSRFLFTADANGVYRSVDGVGAYETITQDKVAKTWTLVRSDQTRLTFDGNGDLIQSQDTNGNLLTYVRKAGKLTQVKDDTGHVTNYVYGAGGNLQQITDETGAVLVSYSFSQNLLGSVTDRAGHVTRFLYNSDGSLFRVTLPQAGTEPTRQIFFKYTLDTTDTTGKTRTLSELTDAEGNRTTFAYAFNRDNFNKYLGGTTSMVNALGVKRTESNDAEYVQWRLDNGYYQLWDQSRYTLEPAYRAQADEIRTRHTTRFTYDGHGALLTVTEPRGFTTSYAYDALENLITVADANADAVTRSDDPYFRDLRRDFGYVNPLTGQGKLVAELTASEIAALKERFTSHFEYDGSGNLLKRTDNNDNVTTFTYTSFNKVASQTSAMGNALVTRDDPLYQDKRRELGYAALVASLSAADKQALLNLFTTFYSYDAKQNLIEQKSPGGDLTRFAYDAFGNLVKKTVFLDANDLVTPAKQQVTQFFYDAFGQNIKTVDAEGNATLASFDHFGNRTSVTDANGGVTTLTYDNDNRVLTVTDAEGFVTVNTYDSVGNRISVRDANGHTVIYVYSANNLLVSVTSPSADGDTAKDRVTRHAYDVVGNNTSVTDANGNTTSYAFREDNRLVAVTTPSVPNAAGQSVKYTTSYAYDGVGNRISVRDNNGNVTQYVYDPDKLLVRQTDAIGQVTQYSFDANLNRVMVVMGAQLAPAQRQVLRFGYDEEDQLITQADAQGGVTRFDYDAPGNRVATTDALGRVTDFTYDRNNRLIRETRPAVTDPVSGLPVRYTVQHQYDGNGNQVATTDENGHVTRFSFDRDNRQVMVEDGNGIKTVYTYDSRHNRTSVQIGVQAHFDTATRHAVVDSTENAQVTTHVYDEFNQRIATTDGVGNALVTSDSALYRDLRKSFGMVDAAGQGKLVAQLTAADKQALKDRFTERYAYDKVGNYTQTTDHLGRSTSFTYDAMNRQLARTDALGGVTRSAYDGNGNVVKETDALGRLTSRSYDAVNRLVDTTDALGVVSHSVYDSFGNRTAQTGAAGTPDARTVQYVYDLNNRLVRQTDAEGHTQSYEYDAVGNRLRVVDARGSATQYVYDALNRNIRLIDPLSFQTRFEYDGVGNRITVVDARGGIQRLTYDAGNRYIQTTDAEGRSTRFTYDVRGNRITQTTAFGTALAETTTFEYDAENNLRSVTDAEGNVSRTAYDGVYNRTQTVDGNGHATSYAFDALNRQVRVTDAEGGATSYTYDAVSNRLTQTDALGRATSYVYDARNQLISQFGPDGVETRYAYDRVGNRVSLTRAANTPLAATTTFIYNRDDQLVSQTDPLGHTTSYAYDANHNRTVVTDPRGNATAYVYDADNRVTSITDPLGNVVEYRYDGNGNRVQVIDARGATGTTYYNADNEVVLSVDNEGFATGFAYDANGNVTSQTLFARALALPLDPALRPTPVSDPKDQTTRFAYDRLNRLTQRTDGEGFVTQFVYDAVGNRLQTRQALDLAATSFATRRSYYDGVNREVAALTAEGYLTQNVYDAVGNRLSRTQFDQKVAAPANGSRPAPAAGDTGRTTSFAYDRNNRLIRQTSALGIASEHSYDARGNRIATTEAAGTPDARTTLFTFDAADRYVETTNALGVKTHMELDANGNVVVRREAFGTADERVFSFVYDANNRVSRQTDALGVVTTTSYDASGNVVSATQAAGLPETRTQSFSYDRNNRQVSATNAAGETTTYAYDAAGNRVRLTQAPGRPEERSNLFVYDRDNRLFQGIDGVGTVTEYHYDGAGNKLETVQAKGTPDERHTLYVYDKDNRLTQVTDPQGGVTRYEYDVLGNQTRVTDANGGVQQNSFDAIGRSVSSLSAGGVLTRNTYDRRDNLVSATQSFADLSDARTTTYAYDLLNRQTRVTDGEGFSTSFVYDAFGNQTSITRGQYLVAPTDPGFDPDKAARAFEQTNSFVYDKANRMLSLTDAEGNVIAYAYDAVGNRLSTTEAANTAPRTTRYAYDLANRLVATRTPEGGLTRNTYDQVGNKVAEDRLQSGDEFTGVFIHKRFEYDRNGRLTAEVDPFLVRTEYAYDRLGNQVLRRAAAGTPDERTVRTEYDRNNRKTADIDALGSRTTYAYDAMGNRTRLTDARGKSAQYFFDGANQLAKVIDPEGFVNTFKYDAAGNQVEQHIFMVTSPDRIVRMEYNRANKLSARVEPDGARTEIRYDGAGNKIQEKRFANTSAPRTMAYAYDLDNRLVRFTDVDGTVSTFGYDGANNRLSEVVSNPADPNGVRATFYQYDLNNRRITETFDPNGLNIVLRNAYDKLGNLVAKTDGNGHTTSFAFDLNNRTVSQTDALGNTATFRYDAVGNQVEVRDLRGFATVFEYDGNNRKVKEIRPPVEVFTIEGGPRTLSPTVMTRYDAVGNVVQVTDPNGFVTTSYFDGNNRMVAEVSGDNVLCEYSYNASGEETSKTTHMTRLAASAHDPAVRPTPPAGERRVVTYAYDLAGRLTQTTYPPAEITALTNTDTNNPTPIKVIAQVTERKTYDAFGNEVESFDRNGSRAVSYYDVKGRKVAMVDVLGFLVEWDYDAQDNQVEQRVYKQALDPLAVSPGTRPTPPAGEVFVTSIRYDAASRKIEEKAPQIEVFDPATQITSFARPTTTYTYDRAGNELTKTLGAGSAQAVTEYSYYDAANHRVAVVNAGRVLSTYQYDANGNVTLQKRFFSPVPMSVDLASLTGSTDFATLVAADPANDEAKSFIYDAVNRRTREADLMGPGAADDLVKLYRYDATQNRTFRQDEDGFVTQSSYDAKDRPVQTITADGSGTVYQYDAAGNRILVFTGKVENAVLAPTDFQATLDPSAALKLQWHVAAGRQTWVAYDTFSRATPADYANRTTTQFSFDGSAHATIASAPTGTTLFFRFVAQDGAGNLSWSAEQSLTIPPRFRDVAVTEPDANTLEVTARFDAGAVNPTLQFHSPGNPFTPVPFVQQPDGSYKATIHNVTSAQAQALSFKLVWQDAAGRTYESAEQPFEARAAQAGITSEVSQATVSNSTGTIFTIHVDTRVPTPVASTLSLVQARWRLAGSNAAFAATAVSGVDSGQGYFAYSLVLGGPDGLAAGNYEILLDGVRADGTSLALDRFTFTVGAGATPASEQSLSWTAPPAGTDQLVILDGQTAFSERRDGRVLVDSDVANNTSTAYDVFYSTRQPQPNTLDVTSTAVTEEVPNPDDPTGPPIIIVTGYDLGVTETLDAAETANIAGDLHLAWRPAGTGIDFANDEILSSTAPNTYSTTLPNLAAGRYDLKVYYHDAFGHEVIVQWRRVDTADLTASFTDRSHIVVARETGGFVSRDAQGVIALDPGLYVGPLDTAALLAALSLTFTETGQGTGRLDADGLTTGYFTENQFNALDYKVATNENDGLWRTSGVDGNGNALETRLYGDDRNNPNFITTFTTFDARGRKLAEFSARVFDPTSGITRRPVRRYTYDVLDKMTSDTDALGNTKSFVYNALGTQIRETDANGGVKTTRVDLFGRETAMVSQLNHSTLKFYDLQGRLIEERDALGNRTGHRYDAFDREVARTDGLGMQTAEADDHTTRYAYDQRDRLVRAEAPQGWHLAHDDADFYKAERERLGFARDAAALSEADRNALIAHYAVTYAYDGRDHVTGTFYPLGQRTDELYDANGRLTETRLFLNGSPATSRRAYDAYGNTIAEVDAEGRAKSKVYGGFGRLQEEVDEDGNRIDYAYDVFGRVIREFDPNGGKDVRRSYDDGGRMTSVQDFATGVSTSYTYDLTGKRFTEVMTTPGGAHNRSIAYEYDRLGQMVRWADAFTGLNENTFFDAEGNRVRAFTDLGYDPLGQNTGGNPNFRYVDHRYTFDAARRVTREVQATVDAQGNAGETPISEFGYDAANNRIRWNNAGTEITYVFDANARAVSGDFNAGGVLTHQAWTYDAIGNVLTFRTLENGSQKSATTNTYNDANRTLSTVTETAGKDTQTTSRSYDRSLRITQTVLRQGGKTFNYNHSYFGDGREKSIVAFGDANGNSTSTYDANKIRSSVNLGQGDGQDRPEIKNFTPDNEGHLVSQFHDDGKSGTREVREYLYANGNPWGETGNGVDGVKQVFIDSGNYALIQNLGDTFPGGVLTYTTREGDSLMAIASQMYGNPSLWFVIADANGLDANARLEAGKTLTIPNSVKTGTITAENHKVYSESEIVGSTLPNLKTPPPPKPKKGCGSIIMIIIIVVIAIVVAVVTYGAGTAISAALIGSATGIAATLATVAVFAVVGAVVAAIGSIVQQGLFIALGYQDSFNWDEVGKAAIVGAITGAASGLGAAAKAAAAAGELSQAGAQFARVGVAALKVAAGATKQILDGGKITSWTSLASAAIGGYLEAGGEIASGAEKAATAAETAEQLSSATQLYQAVTQGNSVLSNINTYVTPWAQLAETYIRNDGKLTPSDWANAAGSTLASAVVDNFGASGTEASQVAGRLQNGALRLATNAVVAGALSRFDKDAAESYFENAVGQEVGQFIGDSIGGYLKSTLFAPPNERPGRRVSEPDRNGQIVDENGNPAPTMYEGDDEIVDDILYGGTSDDELEQDLNGIAPPYPVADNAEPPAPAETAPTSHTVARGDNLSKLAKKYYGDPDMWPLIAAANGIERPDQIKPGQTLTLPPKEDFDVDKVHALAQGFYKAKEQIEQARREAMAAATPVNEPVVSAAATAAQANSVPQPATAPDALTEGRAEMRSYWRGLQDKAVENGGGGFLGFLGYAGAAVMEKLGDVGYSAAEMGVAIYKDPKAGLTGAGKGVVNFGPEAFNGAVNLTKTSLDGLTLIAESAGVPQGTFAGFRETQPYNITPLMEYNGKAEQGGAILANIAIGAAVTKYGSVELGSAAGETSNVVKVYRVEGIPNQRVNIGASGEVSLAPDNSNMLFLNFGEEARAQEFLAQKIQGGLPGATIKSFDVDAGFLKRLQTEAVPQRLGKLYPDRPQLVDVTKAPNQFGIPSNYFDDLMNSIRKGSGK